MKCEMYWGGIPCESENTISVNVKLASGGNKKIYMCPECHYKYFGKRQRRPTKDAPDRLWAAAGVASVWVYSLAGDGFGNHRRQVI